MLADQIAHWPSDDTVYVSGYGRDPERARQERPHRLVDDLIGRQAGRLVIDSREGQERTDERTIRRVPRRNIGFAHECRTFNPDEFTAILNRRFPAPSVV